MQCRVLFPQILWISQQIVATNSTPTTTINSLMGLSTALTGQAHIHTAKLALASSSIPPSTSNFPRPVGISSANSIVSNDLMPQSTVTNSIKEDESKILLRDYVNLPPPPPYPGTVPSSTVAMTSSIVHATPIHGHSTSNVSAGSSGKI